MRTNTSPPASSENTTTSHLETGFKTIEKGSKPVHQVIHPTICSTRFQILEQEDELASSYLVGDSMIHQQLTELCVHMKHRRQLLCLPDAVVDDVTDLFHQVYEEASNE